MSTRGDFYAVNRSIWAKVCELGMNESVAYLALACGSGRDNRTTSWSSQALHKYTGITWQRGKTAIDRLIRNGLLKFGVDHSKERPRYELNLPKPRRGGSANDDERIWLPNSLVMGTTTGEVPPMRRLRSAGDLWALRLLIDFYYVQNLRDDGGISPSVLRRLYERTQVGEQGPYIIWGFREKNSELSWHYPFESHRNRPKANQNDSHPVWQSLELLEEMGLLMFVPHLLENDSGDAEVIHAFGCGSKGEQPIETAIGEAANAAAVEMGDWKIESAEREGYDNFCPILKTLPNVRMVGIARLKYRPHTSRTAAWHAHLHETGTSWIAHYRELQLKAAKCA